MNSPAEPAGLRKVVVLRWLGVLPTRIALYILISAALLGVLGTLLTGSEPGGLLSYLIITGSVVAALGIRRRSLYLLIPLPALIFFICAVLTGAVKDSSIDTNKTELGVSFLQWIASVFFPMCVATIIVLVIGGGRWLLSRQLVAGQFGMSADAARGGGPRAAQAPGQPADRDGRPPPLDRDPWAAPWDRDEPAGQRANRQADARAPRGDQSDTRVSRGDQGDAGAPWEDRRQPPAGQPPDRPVPSFQPIDRSQPGTQPPTQPQPGGQANRPQPGGQPSDRGRQGGQPERGQSTDRGHPGGQPTDRVNPGGQPSDRGQPGGRRPGNGLPDDPAIPPDQDPWGKRDPWNRRGSRGPGNQSGNRERPEPRDPWGSR